MPTNVVAIDKMGVGRKGKGKHWTKAEVEARRQAAAATKRKKPKAIKPPAWIENDPPAFAIWQRLVLDAKGLDLLDCLDANTLATYCKLEVQKQKAMEEDDIKLFEKLSKTCLLYAKSLGLTPEARARLAKARADGNKGDPNADLFE